MKNNRILTSLVAFFAVISVQAQIVFQVNGDSHGLINEYTDVINVGYIWGTTSAFTVSNPFATMHHSTNGSSATTIDFDGSIVVPHNGVQGQDNPKDANGDHPSRTLLAPASGSVIKIDAKQDGWIYIVASIAPNKAYMVFENGTPIGYKLAMRSTMDIAKDGVISYEITGEGEFGYLPSGRQIRWVCQEFLDDDNATFESYPSGFGVICFPVFKGCSYYTCGAGSKISWFGIYFNTTQASKVTYKFNELEYDSEEVVLLSASRAATPKVSRVGNLLTLSTTTPDATIYYTTDGTAPTSNSTKYEGPFTVSQNCKVKAIAISKDMESSNVMTYTVDWFKVEDVTISMQNKKVLMSTATPNARIFYTLDGSIPTENSTLYTEPFAVSVSCTVKAAAYKNNFKASNIATFNVDLENLRCDQPILQVTDNVVTMSCFTENSTIYYTLDGTEPTAGSSRYTGPVTLTRNATVKAIAMATDYLPSVVGSCEVTYFQVAMPSFTKQGSVVSISSATEGATIYYVIGDGPLDVTEQNKYTEPITLTDNSIVRAIGVLDGFRNSEEASYQPNSFTCGDVSMSYNGRYIQLTSATEGAAIYYTKDGSNPTTTSTKYDGKPFAVDGICTINAFAVKENMNNSNVLSKNIAYVYDGETAILKDAGMLYNAFAWSQGRAVLEKLVVKGPLNTEDLSFIKNLGTVTQLDLHETTIEGAELPEKTFSGMNLFSIELPAGLSKVGPSLFDGCSRLAAIIWNSNIPLTEEILTGVDNPNLLLYVNALTLTSRTTNVVSMAMNKAINLVLHDEANGTFFCPRAFRADQASYTRRFSLESGKHSCGGWETIALPYTVSTVLHEKNGLLAPFGSTVPDAKPYWLYSMVNGNFNPAMELVANTPYIISMPNHPDYAEEYNQKGQVTFSATNVEIPVTPTTTDIYKSSDVAFIPVFSPMAKSMENYAINTETWGDYAAGSLFIRDLRDLRPFEAYLSVNIANAPAYYSLFDDKESLGIEGIHEMPHEVESDTVKVYNLSGTLVKTGRSRKVLKELTAGIYIVNGKKIVIK